MGSFKDAFLKAGLATAKDVARVDRAAEADEAAARDAVREAAAAAHVATAPRYPNASPIRLADARALFASHQARLDAAEAAGRVEGALDPEIFTLPSVQLIDGDVALDELVLAGEGSNLIVRGDLTITGVLHQEFRAGGLVVLGQLTAGHIVTTGSILCMGDLDVPGTLFGSSTNYATDVLGHARVGTLVSVHEHLYSFWGGWTIGSVVGERSDTLNIDRYGAREERAWRPELAADLEPRMVAMTLRAYGTLFVP